MSRVYLDHNATSPLRPEARDAVLVALGVDGNASAVHRNGRSARAIIETAREQVARLTGGEAKNVTFTSGGSEAAATLLSPGFRGRHSSGEPIRTLTVSAVEHSCVLAGGRFPADTIRLCPVDTAGLIDLDALEALLAETAGPHLVSVMAANNETGVIQPLAGVAAICKTHGASLVVDAVQALGKIDLDIASLGADAIFVSGHKIGGPQGVGAIIRASEAVTIEPLIRGGGQEMRQRAGTENLSGIAGFGAAARVVAGTMAEEAARLSALRDWMEAEIVSISPKSRVVGLQAARLPNTSLTIHPGLDGETALIALDLANVSVSTGSACSSGKVQPSHVLAAMGLGPAEAKSALRISLGWSTTQDDVARFVAAFAAHAKTIAARTIRAA